MSGVASAIRGILAEAGTVSLKRLAWAYGCAPKGSAEERELEQALRARIAAEADAARSRLARARVLAGLSRSQAAKLLGWAQGPLCAMESGVGAPPTNAELRQLADLYGVSAAWLAGADPVVPADAARALRDANITPRERESLTELLGAIQTPGRAGGDR
ncbi:MAG TPA: helix-turn-helix transcriptional regulator [Mycobacterium sp.]|nr:helix-turn-helix transcriptional regulator [Mycobacterium sp.]